MKIRILPRRTMLTGIAFLALSLFLILSFASLSRVSAQGPTAEPTGGNVTPNFSGARFGATHEFRSENAEEPLGTEADVGAPGFTEIDGSGMVRIETKSSSTTDQTIGLDVSMQDDVVSGTGIRVGSEFNINALINLRNFLTFVGFPGAAQTLPNVLTALNQGISGAITSALPTPLFGAMLHGQHIGATMSGKTGALAFGQSTGIYTTAIDQLKTPFSGSKLTSLLSGTGNGGVGIRASGTNSGVRASGITFGNVGSANIVGSIGEGRIGTIGLGGKDMLGNYSDTAGVGGALLGTFLGSFNEGERIGTVSLAGKGARCTTPAGPAPAEPEPAAPPPRTSCADVRQAWKDYSCTATSNDSFCQTLLQEFQDYNFCWAEEYDDTPCAQGMTAWRGNFCTQPRATFSTTAPNPYYYAPCRNASTTISGATGCSVPTDCETLEIAWSGLSCTVTKLSPRKTTPADQNCVWINTTAQNSGCGPAPNFVSAAFLNSSHLTASLFDIPSVFAQTAAAITKPSQTATLKGTYDAIPSKQIADTTQKAADSITNIKGKFTKRPRNVITSTQSTLDQGALSTIASLKEKLFDTFAPHDVSLPDAPDKTETCSDDFGIGVVSQVIGSPKTFALMAVDLGMNFINALRSSGAPATLVSFFEAAPQWSFLGLGPIGTFGSSIIAISEWDTAANTFSSTGGHIISLGGNFVTVGGNVMAGTSTRADGSTVGGNMYAQGSIVSEQMVVANEIQLGIRENPPTQSEACPQEGRIIMTKYNGITSLHMCRRYTNGNLRWRAMSTIDPYLP